jgi:glycerol-3-phosphate acyltransferase PlsY
MSGFASLGTWFSLLFSYLIGSICFGMLIARRHGIDLREVGSGNIGSTNVLRVIGKKEGSLTLAGDVLKGVIAVGVALFLIGRDRPVWMALASLAAILGHNYPLYFGFKGGKGVATTFGVLFVYMPVVGLLLLLIWGVAVAITHISSVGALSISVMLPVLAFLISHDAMQKGFAVVVAVMMIVRHRENIRRLLRREES